MLEKKTLTSTLVCFGLAVRDVQIPRDMTSVSKSCPRYNGAEKPNSWLSDYALAVQIAGGGGRVACRFLPLMLEGTARSWIENLPEKSIHNWKDMERVFTQHFQGTYKRPSTYNDLTRCVQKPEETATQFLARWIQTKASCENVDDNQAIHAFTRGLLKGSSLRHRLVREVLTPAPATRTQPLLLTSLPLLDLFPYQPMPKA